MSIYDFAASAKQEVKNTIEFVGKAKNISLLSEKISALKKKKSKLHILEIGDSHVQSDLKGSEVRRVLQTKYGNAGLGWFYPYSVMKTNNPVSFKSSSTDDWEVKRAVFEQINGSWGVCPIAVESQSPNAKLHFGMSDKSFLHESKRLAVFYGGMFSESFSPLVMPKNEKKLLAKKYNPSAVWFESEKVFGDFELHFEAQLPSQKSFICNGLYSENGKNGVIYSSAGANGADIPAYLRGEKLEDNLREMSPDIVVVSLGTNDCRRPNFSDAVLRANLEKLTNRIRTALPDAVIMITTPPLCRSNDVPEWDKKLETAVRCMRDFAEKNGFLLWDFYRVMASQKKLEQWLAEDFISKDYLHLSPKGYRKQGDWFALAWTAFLENF